VRIRRIRGRPRAGKRWRGRAAALGESEQLEGEVAGAEAGAGGVGDDLVGLGVRFLAEAEEGEVADDDGEEVVEVVGDAAGEEAEGLELGGAHEGGLEARGLLLFELGADEFGLLAHATAQSDDPGDAAEHTQGKDGTGRECSTGRPPWRGLEDGDVGRGAQKEAGGAGRLYSSSRTS
jgi:hypothetical protein